MGWLWILVGGVVYDSYGAWSAFLFFFVLFPSGPDGVGCCAFCIGDFWDLHLEASGRCEQEFLHLQVMLTTFLAGAITRVHFS